MGTKDSVSISLRLDRPLWSRLRAVAEQERDAGGRASLRGVILRTLTREFAEGVKATGAKNERGEG